jgi:hypothetical protein
VHISVDAAPSSTGRSESEGLRRKIELVLPALVDASRRLMTHPRIAKLYPEYLFTTHCVIRASVPLMEIARDRAAQLAETDQVARGLASYLEKHIPEEHEHDAWLLDDLAALGHDSSAMLARPPTPTVAAAVGAQYYWVLHYHPVAVLGYVAVLEGYPPSPEMVEELERRTGFPRAAFHTLAAHAELDPGHRDEMDAALDELPLTPEQTTVLGLSAMTTVRLLAQAIDEVGEARPSKRV